MNSCGSTAEHLEGLPFNRKKLNMPSWPYSSLVSGKVPDGFITISGSLNASRTRWNARVVNASLTAA
jgi:hypothetical protein